MKTFIAVIIGLTLAALAVWFLLVGGIVQVVNGATASPVDGMGIAVGVLRVLLTGAAISLGIFVAGVLRVIAD